MRVNVGDAAGDQQNNALERLRLFRNPSGVRDALSFPNLRAVSNLVRAVGATGVFAHIALRKSKVAGLLPPGILRPNGSIESPKGLADTLEVQECLQGNGRHSEQTGCCSE